MPTLDVGLCQYALGSADTMDELEAAVVGLFDRAGAADVYVLPELFACDLRLVGEDTPVEETALSTAEVDRYHEFLHGEAASRDALIVGGSYNVVDDGTVYNRMPVVSSSGIETYDKRHPTPSEREAGKTGGDAAPPVVEHAGATVGVLNCYDVEFPELARSVVEAGAELLCVPSWTGSTAGYQRVSRCAAARAVENQCYVASVPLVGAVGDSGGVGRGSVFAPCDDVLGPHGTRLRLPRDEPAAATCEVDVAALRAARREASVRPYTDHREGYR